MFSYRIFPRSIPISFSRSFSQTASISRSFSQPTSLKFYQSFLASRWKSSTLFRQPRLIAPFSTYIHKLEKQGTVDEELVLKLDSELVIETEMKSGEGDEMPSQLKEFIQGSPFKINDSPGYQDVELVRKFGDETIRVYFTTADLQSMADDDSINDDTLLDEEEGTANSSSTQSGQYAGTKQENSSSAAEEEDTEEEFSEEDDESSSSFPARVNVIIEKPNQGALQIEAVAQDGMIVIENVLYHKNASLATAKTAEADWEKRGMYGGPPFGHLDEELQLLLERYLDERGINTSLALFVPDYIDYKEQKEYLNWLENVRNFVDA